MRILIYSPHSIWAPHFETDLEIALHHVEEGDEITLPQCGAKLLSCAANPTHRKGICYLCQSRSGIKFLKRNTVKVEQLYDIDPEQQLYIEKASAISFKDLNELKAYKPFDVDIGRAF